MKAPAFEYVRAESLSDVHEALEEALSDDLVAKVLAGGQSLVPLMNFRLARPDRLVDINRLGELRHHELEGGVLRLGALCRHADIERDPDVMAASGALADAVPLIGHPSVRARGTVVGSLAHGDPLAEWIALLLLFDGAVTLSSRRGRRTVGAADWLEGYLRTAAADDELVEEATFVLPGDGGPGRGSAFVEVAHRHGDFCLVAAAASLTLGDGGEVAAARLVVAGLGPVPFRAVGVETGLAGLRPTEAAFAQALESLPDEDAQDDLHATAGYRRHTARVVAARALVAAAGRASGGAAA